jgi:hypothetical protein
MELPLFRDMIKGIKGQTWDNDSSDVWRIEYFTERKYGIILRLSFPR